MQWRQFSLNFLFLRHIRSALSLSGHLDQFVNHFSSIFIGIISVRTDCFIDLVGSFVYRSRLIHFGIHLLLHVMYKYEQIMFPNA